MYGYTKDIYITDRRGNKRLPEDQKRYWDMVRKFGMAAKSNLGDGAVAAARFDKLLRENPYGYLLPSIVRQFPECTKYWEKASHIRQAVKPGGKTPRTPNRSENLYRLSERLALAGHMNEIAKRLGLSKLVTRKIFWVSRKELRKEIPDYRKDATLRNALGRDGIDGRGFRKIVDKRRDMTREKDRHGHKEVAVYMIIPIPPSHQLTGPSDRSDT